MMKSLRYPYPDAEPQHRREIQTFGNTTYDAIVSRYDLHFALDEQRNRPLPGNHPQWFVRGIEQECPFHGLWILLSTTRGFALLSDTLTPVRKTFTPFSWNRCVRLSAFDDPPKKKSVAYKF